MNSRPSTVREDHQAHGQRDREGEPDRSQSHAQKAAAINEAIDETPALRANNGSSTKAATSR